MSRTPSGPVHDAAAAATDAAPTCPGRTIFLNRGGGDYTRKPDDSSSNTSTLITTAHTFGPFTIDDIRWAAIRDFVANRFAPFDVVVTDVDPGSDLHIETPTLGADDWRASVLPASAGVVAAAQFAEKR